MRFVLECNSFTSPSLHISDVRPSLCFRLSNSGLRAVETLEPLPAIKRAGMWGYTLAAILIAD